MQQTEIGHRIRLARLKEGLSLRDLAARLNGLVSAQAIGKYERNEMHPGSSVLLALAAALNVTVDYILAPKNTRLGRIDFRKLSRTSVREKSRVEAEVLGYVERYLQLESILGNRLHSEQREAYQLARPEQAEEVADYLRQQWRLGTAPIANVTEFLEELGQVVIVVTLPDNVSGLTCEVQRDGENAVHVLVANKQHSLERRRLTLVHELAHRYLVVPGDEKATEKAANRFAGAFLMSSEHLALTIGPHRRKFEAPEILDLKQIYRVSASALWYRLCQLGYTTQSQYEYGCRTFGRGWRGKVEPRELEPLSQRGTLEMPRLFERKCFRALAEGLIGVPKAAELLDRSIEDVGRLLRGGL